jgi:hypothetical protein
MRQYKPEGGSYPNTPRSSKPRPFVWTRTVSLPCQTCSSSRLALCNTRRTNTFAGRHGERGAGVTLHRRPTRCAGFHPPIQVNANEFFMNDVIKESCAPFNKKCSRRLAKYREQGRTVAKRILQSRRTLMWQNMNRGFLYTYVNTELSDGYERIRHFWFFNGESWPRRRISSNPLIAYPQEPNSSPPSLQELMDRLIHREERWGRTDTRRAAAQAYGITR